MRQIIEFNPESDISEVDQFGFVDINKAFQNGYVPGSNSSTTLDFDGTDIDPSAIIGKPSDVFEAMRMQDSLMKGIDNSRSSSVKSDEN